MSEYRDITPTCRINRGTTGAFDQAAEELKIAYSVMGARHPNTTFRITLTRLPEVEQTDDQS